MQQVAEQASFRGNDDPRLVQAALACPLCLSGEVEWALQLADWEAHVECSCRACGHVRSVGLNSDQALRLSIHQSLPLSA